ncbi:MAG: hypothetical protein RSD95_13415 [Clostridia bacterium]
MDFQGFLQLLRDVSKPNARGEVRAKCPAHDDKKASLNVRENDKGDGILLRCHAGCTSEAICGALGITLADLFYEKPSRATEKRAPALSEKPERRYASYADAYGYLGELVCCYRYTDERGKMLFEVARILERDGGKTFRQHRPAPEAKELFPIIKSVPEAMRVLYRLPQLIEAIGAGQSVFLVEGEKDVETLCGLGFVATTNPGGASKGKTKWLTRYTEQLRGADVVIIPDNDEPGRNHATQVAGLLVGVAARVRLIELAPECPQLPEKGDVSDFFAMLGTVDGKKALGALVARAPDYIPDERAYTESMYEQVPGYSVMNGSICVQAKDGLRRLSTFMVLPRADVTRDDGVTIEHYYAVDGWTASGASLPRLTIPARSFASMGWASESWGFRANIMPGATTKDSLRYVIQAVGAMTARYITQYAHTGWRRIDGKMCYLYHGGAIGADACNVELDGPLARYSLDAPRGVTIEEGCYASIGVGDHIAPHVSIPLLGAMYLAPLREFLEQTGIPPSFSLYLLGDPGSAKTTGAALVLSHFGNFGPRTPPASFKDTANAVRKKAFQAKDLPLLVDDYHPETSLQERRRMESIAQSLSRAFGDGSDRGRLDQNRQVQRATPPRCVAIMTGEDLPNIGASGIDRMYVVSVANGDIPINEDLTNLQELARKGHLVAAMRGYIEWLLERVDTLPDMLHERFRENQSRAGELIRSGNRRSPEAVAHLMLGYQMMIEYMADIGVYGEDTAQSAITRAWRIVTENSKKQRDEARDERPGQLFLSALGEMIAAKTAVLGDLASAEKAAPAVAAKFIGYRDAQNYYFLPDLSYALVSEMFTRQGRAFPLSKNGLYKQMRGDGLILYDHENGKSTRQKKINGRVCRLLWVPRVYIDGKSEVQTQTKMDYFLPDDDRRQAMDDDE